MVSIVDPVDDFLARERQELGDLGNEFNGTGAIDISETFAGNEHNSDNEPECLKQWLVDFQNRILQKDLAEKQKLAELEDQGMKDLNAWAMQYRESLARAIKNSRIHDKELREEQNSLAAASSAFSDADANCAALWERICELCNFTTVVHENGISAPDKLNAKDPQKDLHRMRVLLLQLKQKPPSVRSSNHIA